MAHVDAFAAYMTVYEQLLYTSELKNPQKESIASKKARVDFVLEQLSLTGCKDITIGSVLNRGISGKFTLSII